VINEIGSDSANTQLSPSFSVNAEHIGVIDPEFILSKALTIDENGQKELKIDVLGVTNREEMVAYFDATESDTLLNFIFDIYTRKNIDNNYALAVLTDYEMDLPLSKGVNQ
jgi:hypothetical protein